MEALFHACKYIQLCHLILYTLHENDIISWSIDFGILDNYQNHHDICIFLCHLLVHIYHYCKVSNTLNNFHGDYDKHTLLFLLLNLQHISHLLYIF